MADEPKRPPDGKGRRGVSRRLEYRRPRRDAVPAGPWDDAGELPQPEPLVLISLPDPRR